ncbi:peptidoglycan DD-metalloendopeptidase family protein [Rhabdobacter roseus]|uniref:Septal ring factor EnvC (AmiA/AmiB activator) n=1 Tax=Rhabdobacter roseus TaxID=1655419 RepID=A0A840TK22_9BACT|nr:peptidoglycan DD-metalloendopeptidase family protein [Rhabdobacter roseus]MBB5282147.1 septal ring factor EnvC (AmiA/AmiB activator) [Rhabdobacter roseus]
MIAGTGVGAWAQKSRQQLEREKRQNQEKMKEIQGILKETSSQKNVSVGQLRALNQQITTQKKQIDLLSDDLKLLDVELRNLEKARRELANDLSKLKKEYGQMIYEASKRNAYLNQLIFLFSSSTFNQFVLRYKYLKQYTDARQQQVKQMEEVQRQLVAKRERITAKQKQQQTVLATRVGEAQKLEGLKAKQDEVVNELSQKESQLRAELTASRRAANQLEANIRRLVEREMRERAERERREREARERAERERLAREKAERERAAKAGEEPVIVETAPVEKAPSSGGMTDEEVALASSFMASQARLPWPVKGFVSDHFGRKAHPVLKGVTVDNLGIDIQTSAGESVRAVYDGVVLDVTDVPGMNNVVAIQHGDYMTIYAKMQNVSVKTGQKVKARETIGSVATDGEGTSELQFQIWKNTTRLNPEQWLLRR